MKEPKKYVLTGGPSSGKTSIILALEQRGEYIVREAAEDYIRIRQAQGQPAPWTELDFQEGILKLQVQREKRIPKDVRRVFIDRGVHDGLAYLSPEIGTYRKVMAEAREHKYNAIFLIDALKSMKKTDVRRETQDEAHELRDKLEQVYKQAGYKPILVKKAPLKQRLEQILSTLE